MQLNSDLLEIVHNIGKMMVSKVVLFNCHKTEETMAKADIIERIRTSLDIPNKESAEMLEAVLSTMKATLESGENLNDFQA